MSKRLDLTGQRFGRLIANRYLGNRKWSCTCDCGKEVVVYSGHLRDGHTRSCGCLCKEVSQETRIKLSETSKGRKHTQSSKNKMSEAKMGNKNPHWNHTLTAEERIVGRKYPEYYEWRKLVYEKDRWTCQKCGYKGTNIRAHHIESYNNNRELRTSLDNGITLCNKCHDDFHHQYGYNTTIEQLNKFMEEN